jgi:hypothetical protein
VHFSPTAHVATPAKIYFRKHADFVAGKKQHLVFMVVNPYPLNLSEDADPPLLALTTGILPAVSN